MLLDRQVSGIVFVSGLHADTDGGPRALPQAGRAQAADRADQRVRARASRRRSSPATTGRPANWRCRTWSRWATGASGSSPARNASCPYSAKLAGFRAAMTRLLGCPRRSSASLVALSLFGVEGGAAAAGRLLDRGVTGIVCGSDLMALGAIREARSRGLRVPGDVSVVGYDDSPLIAFTDPPLTTVRQPVTAMAVAARTRPGRRDQRPSGAALGVHVPPGAGRARLHRHRLRSVARTPSPAYCRADLATPCRANRAGKESQGRTVVGSGGEAGGDPGESGADLLRRRRRGRLDLLELVVSSWSWSACSIVIVVVRVELRVDGDLDVVGLAVLVVLQLVLRPPRTRRPASPRRSRSGSRRPRRAAAPARPRPSVPRPRPPSRPGPERAPARTVRRPRAPTRRLSSSGPNVMIQGSDSTGESSARSRVTRAPTCVPFGSGCGLVDTAAIIAALPVRRRAARRRCPLASTVAFGGRRSGQTRSTIVPPWLVAARAAPNKNQLVEQVEIDEQADGAGDQLVRGTVVGASDEPPARPS